VYPNRRRMKGEYGKRLLRRHRELLERSFAHCYDTSGMRRTHLREGWSISRGTSKFGCSRWPALFAELFATRAPRFPLDSLKASTWMS
jgi:hypothetical protein